MRKILPLTFSLFIYHAGIAQQNTLDSLLGLLQTHPAEDTVRINLLNDLSFEYNFTNPDKGIQAADEAIAIAGKTGSRLKMAGAFSNKGVNYAAKGNDSAALSLYQKALAIHQELGNLAGVGKAFNNMAIIHVRLSNYAQALEYHAKSYAIFQKMGDHYRMGNALNNTGVVYLYLADYPKALDYYLKALLIFEQQSNDVGIANNLSNIGIIYKNLGDYTKALQFHERALTLFRKMGNSQGEANTLGNMGVVYDKLNKGAKALNCYQTALSINKTLGNKIRIASDLTNIGVTYHGLQNYSAARQYYENALDIYESAGDRNSIVTVLNELGNLYVEVPDTSLSALGIQPSERFIKALHYLTTSLRIAQETGTADRQSESWAGLSSTYEKQKQYGKALDAYKHYIIFRDSIHNVENEKQVTRIEMQFEFEKKEAVAAEEIRRERTLRNATIAGASVLLMAVIISFIFYKRKLDADKKKRIAEFNAEVTETKMKVLRLQMNPHFMFNSLNSIGDYINRNNIAEADRYLTKFARLMRITLENSEQTEVSLAADLEALELYMQLEALRMNNKFSYQLVIDKAINTENTLIPPLLLQPFVENSIVHGLAGKVGKGMITIRIFANHDVLHCVVEDDGIGRTQAATAAGPEKARKRSMGLSITRSRIEMLNKSQATNAAVDIADITQGTRATITVPLQLNF